MPVQHLHQHATAYSLHPLFNNASFSTSKASEIPRTILSAPLEANIFFVAGNSLDSSGVGRYRPLILSINSLAPRIHALLVTQDNSLVFGLRMIRLCPRVSRGLRLFAISLAI